MDGSYSTARGADEHLMSNPSQLRPGTIEAATLYNSIDQTTTWLLANQHVDGYWCAELEGDSILQSEYLLLLAWLDEHRTDDAQQVANHLISQQREDGSFGPYPEGNIDVSASVKAYFALKLVGHSPSADYMIKARDAILEAGGADAVNSFTRFYLALLGQIPFELCPAVPPEMALLPNWFPINIYQMSSWSRTIFVPLSMVWALRPVHDFSGKCTIQELFIQEPKNWPELRCPGQEKPRSIFNWERFFRLADRTLKTMERLRIVPFRRRAMKVATQWILDRLPKSDGLGAIFPPIIWCLIAFKALGFEEDSAAVQSCRYELDKLKLRDGDKTRLQPCKSPIWDTTITLRALAAAGLGMNQPNLRKAIDWLLSKEVKRRGDWSKTVRCEPGGWYFEFNNEFYPDLDDTAMALMAIQEQLEQSGVTLEVHPGESWANTTVLTAMRVVGRQTMEQITYLDKICSATKRGLAWTAAMQNNDGGWGAFDRNNDAEFLCKVPFADHNAMIDPSWPDLTARVLESFGRLGIQQNVRGNLGEVTDRAVNYIRSEQEEDGSWFGRWGVNYIYGTWQCIVGLTEVGIPTDDPAIVRGAEWLISCQQQSGGWGETCNSYENPNLKGIGTPTPSQTAWALLGLIAAGKGNSEAVIRGINYLLRTQLEDGTWDEQPFTGTGFPRVFYLKYHYYRIYFPLLALATFSKLTRTEPSK